MNKDNINDNQNFEEQTFSNNAVEKVENIIRGIAQNGEEISREVALNAYLDQEDDKVVLESSEGQIDGDKQEIINDELDEKKNLKRLERMAKAEKKQELKMQRANRKAQKKQEQRNNESDGGSTKKKGGMGGWITAVVSLGIATIALATALTLTFLIPQEADVAIENMYSKSFYDVVEQVDNIDLNLSKTLATKDSGAMQTYLVDLAINSELAENDVQQLPLQDESKYYTTKLINQIGDYAKYLNKKLINGESLSQEDREILLRLYNANQSLKESLQNTMGEMKSDFSFSSMTEGGEGNLVIKNFNELQNLSVQYPELIYDGPFSDGLDRKEIKGLDGNELTKAEAQDRFESIFADYKLKEVKMLGETNANIVTYNFQANVNDDILYAQISKKGGKLVMFAYAGSCREVNYQDDTAVETAQKFLQDLGLNNLKPVWINLASNVYTINFAYEQNGIIVYSDLIKVRVCAETNMVIGLEGTSYWTNHTKRDIPAPVLSVNSAKTKVNSDISIQTTRLALVPVGNSSEKLCYEFMGEMNDSTYYVYIDATTGKQVEMFKVIESTEGQLLM